ncbi:MAG: glycosyltransferase family 39 protein, partial [Syntrophomonadaceae bacterium]
MALRLWQYLANASLWIDEIALAENVLNRPLGELVGQPLYLDQVAAPGFLALAKGATAAFGSSEYALRLVPLLSGLLALLLFRALARRFQPVWVAALSVAILALAPTLIAHGAEFKPYSMDILASVWLTMAAFAVTDRGAAWPAWLGAIVLGTTFVWFSQGAIFVVAGLGAALVLLARRERRFGAWLGVTLGLWAASAGAAALAAMRRVPTEMRDYLDRFWQPSLPRWPLLLFIAVAAGLLWLRD